MLSDSWPSGWGWSRSSSSALLRTHYYCVLPDERPLVVTRRTLDKNDHCEFTPVRFAWSGTMFLINSYARNFLTTGSNNTPLRLTSSCRIFVFNTSTYKIILYA